MKSFGKQLDELMKLVLEGDLEKVKEHVESMPSRHRAALQHTDRMPMKVADKYFESKINLIF
jgi:hypothetical protein